MLCIFLSRWVHSVEGMCTFLKIYTKFIRFFNLFIHSLTHSYCSRTFLIWTEYKSSGFQKFFQYWIHKKKSGPADIREVLLCIEFVWLAVQVTLVDTVQLILHGSVISSTILTIYQLWNHLSLDQWPTSSHHYKGSRLVLHKYWYYYQILLLLLTIWKYRWIIFIFYVFICYNV